MKSTFLKVPLWGSLFLICLILFSIFKLPEEKLKSIIEAHLQQFFASQGMQTSTKRSELSIGFGISYQMDDLVIRVPRANGPTENIQFSEVKIEPSLLALARGQIGGHFKVTQRLVPVSGASNAPRVGLFQGDFHIAPNSTGSGVLETQFKLDQFEIGKSGILPSLIGLQATLPVSGTGTLNGDLSQPRTLKGSVELKSKAINIDAQLVQGLKLPTVLMQEGVANLKIEGGKILIRQIQLGKTGSPDDLIGTLSGDILFGSSLHQAQCNLKAKFSLSQNFLKSVPLLEALLTPAKQPDGSFGYLLSGPSDALVANPGV